MSLTKEEFQEALDAADSLNEHLREMTSEARLTMFRRAMSGYCPHCGLETGGSRCYCLYDD